MGLDCFDNEAHPLLQPLGMAAIHGDDAAAIAAIDVIDKRLVWADAAEKVLEEVVKSMICEPLHTSRLFYQLVRLLPDDKQEDYMLGG